MRFKVELLLKEEKIPKDKSRMILSFMKHFLEESDKEYFNKIYEKGNVMRKKTTFSLYLPKAEFGKEFIRIPEKHIFLSYSTADLLHGIQLYNSMVKGKNKEYVYKNTNLTIGKVEMLIEKTIREDSVTFKTISPLVIREHKGNENSKTWYHNLSDEKGYEIFVENLKYQLLEELPESKYDIENINVEVISNKKTVVRYYDIDVQSNLCILKINAKAYILNHLYMAGLGSIKSAGFGMVNML